MKKHNKLITHHKHFTLEYAISGRVISVSKRMKGGVEETTFLFTYLNKEQQKKLCALLWLADATPCSAKELAEDMLDSIIK